MARARASNGESIDIPPPRPKRKPLHPYPRKSVDNPKETIKLENSASPEPAAAEKRLSPTSVLSAFASDALSSAVTGQHGRCDSPTSCTTDPQSNLSDSAEKEYDYLRPNSPAHKRKGSFDFLQLSTTSDIDNQCLMVNCTFKLLLSFAYSTAFMK